MWLFFFILAVIGSCGLIVHITLELNNVEKSMSALTETLKRHYGIE